MFHDPDLFDDRCAMIVSMIEAPSVPPSSRLLPVLGVLGILFLVGIACSRFFVLAPSPANPMPETVSSSSPLQATLTVLPPVATSSSSLSTITTTPGTDIEQVNQYWLQRINELRGKEDLRLLRTDSKLIESATDWATYMGENELLTHTRPDEKTMHQWMDARSLPFTERNSPDGWQQNYFTENIARAFSATDVASLEKALDRTLADFLAEQPGDDAHRRTIYAPDWNSVGVGWYVKTLESGQTQIYFVMHYGSLLP